MKLIKKADPRNTTAITLGKDKYIDHLYGSFRIDNPRTEGFKDQRNLEIIFRSGIINQIKVPVGMKVKIPAGKKVVNTDFYKIENIGKNRDSMMLLTMRAGWNQNERDINRMIDLDPQGTFVAKLKGKDFDFPVATSSVLPLGRNNTWIGMILVHPEMRRQGIANQMMQYCVKYAIDKGKIINGLDATPMGNTVYGAVGYVDSYRIWRSFYNLSQFNKIKYSKALIKQMSAKDLEEVIRYDSSSFIERDQIMRTLYRDSDNGCFLARNSNGGITGYCYTRSGRIRAFTGPFIADDDNTAKALITAASQHLLRRGYKEAFIDTPESKFKNKGRYSKKVFDQKQKPSVHRIIKDIKPVRDFTRMYQVVDNKKADLLVNDFQAKEKLTRNSKRVAEFANTMFGSVANYTETLAYMEYERKHLQEKFWGITGPEKG
ncbi:MAG: GNAT family N-acetyltransferase [bacterium]